MVKVEIDDAILLVIVKRKPNAETEIDGVVFVRPTNTQDAIRIQQALTTAQKNLIDLTKRAVIDGAKKVDVQK